MPCKPSFILKLKLDCNFGYKIKTIQIDWGGGSIEHLPIIFYVVELFITLLALTHTNIMV